MVAATAAPSHPELGDTKIIFDGERVTGAHPAPSRPPAMSPIPPQVQHAGNTPARRAQRACRAHPHAWPPRCVAPAPSGCAVAGIETDAHAARLARAAGGVPARPCGRWTPVGRVCASEQRSPQIARCFSQFVACALVVPACQGRLRHSQRCTTVQYTTVPWHKKLFSLHVCDGKLACGPCGFLPDRTHDHPRCFSRARAAVTTTALRLRRVHDAPPGHTRHQRRL